MLNIISLFYQRKGFSEPPTIGEFPRSGIPFIKPGQFAEFVVNLAREYSVFNKKPPNPANINLGVPRSSFSRAGQSWLSALLGLMDPHNNSITPNIWCLAVTKALRDLEIDIIPGPYNHKLSSKRFTQLQDYTIVAERFKPVTTGVAPIQAVLKAKELLVSMPIKIPLENLPQQYLEGFLNTTKALQEKDSAPEGLTSLQLELFFTDVHDLVDLENCAHMYFMIVGWALSALPNPPIAKKWTGKDKEDSTLYAGLRATIDRGAWYFLFVARCMLHHEPSLSTKHPLGAIIKIIEHRQINIRLVEALGIVVRTPGVRRPYPWMKNVNPNTYDYYIRRMHCVKEASCQGLLRFLGLWLEGDLAELAYTSITKP